VRDGRFVDEPFDEDAGADPRPRSEAARRRRRRTRLFLPLLGSIVAIAFLFVGVFPTRALLAQRSDIANATETLSHIEARNAELSARVDALSTDAEIERIAREQYHLVYPGEEAYALLPAAPPQIPVPDAWPFRGLRTAVISDPGH
jgi:cell division protein FtsB